MPPNSKGSNPSDDDWVGELLVGVVKVASIGMFRFALRWPDIAALLTVFAVTGVLAGLPWTCVLTAVCAAGVWGWRLGWPDSYERLIGKPVADYRRTYLVYRRRWRTICQRHGLTISQRGKLDVDPLVPDLSSVNRPGMSGDSTSWEGWSHVREYVEALPAGAAGAGGADGRRDQRSARFGVGSDL